MTSEPRDRVRIEARIERKPGWGPYDGFDVEFEGPADLEAWGGGPGVEIKIEITPDDRDRHIYLEMLPDDARWLAALLIEIADHHDKYHPTAEQPHRSNIT